MSSLLAQVRLAVCGSERSQTQSSLALDECVTVSPTLTAKKKKKEKSSI